MNSKYLEDTVLCDCCEQATTEFEVTEDGYVFCCYCFDELIHDCK